MRTPAFLPPRRSFTVVAALTTLLAIPALSPPAYASGAEISKVSTPVTGTSTDGDSTTPVVSDDGRYVAFASGATNLVNGDTNNSYDIFLTDRRDGTTRRLSIAANGAQADSASYGPSITADGHFILFYSYAANLVPGDTNGVNDLFLYDTRLQSLRRIDALAGDGTNPFHDLSSARISADGSTVVLSPTAALVPGDTNGSNDVYAHDLATSRTDLISHTAAGTTGNGASFAAAVSAGGRYVAFLSYATDLVAGDTNATADVFLRDRSTGTVTRVNLTHDGRQFTRSTDMSLAVSADGRYVTFASAEPTAVPGDTNANTDVFVRDVTAGRTSVVSAIPGGTPGSTYSADPVISANGRYIAFRSLAANLVPGDTNGDYDVFVRDLRTQRTTLVSLSASGQQGNGSSYQVQISANGRRLAFVSSATNLVPGDAEDDTQDVFVRNR
ncbi:hypothetical protein [Actinoplanes sp. NBRC 101535]|uniref:TolB family protein n=1 Tax=Actinoplanes sp. NBRC 101535 TaxID=3032196 RepID=UPI0024A48775|nr:hypothetical protein [Actinoplanes sp. NBRC 101535]GLY08495.1 hypothetical protein Acsp01_88740 [Actinoplanes sp. NBRC 101535]